MPLVIGTHLGSYEIVAPIGAGGMGEVYRATDTQLGRAVAIKVLPDSVVHDAERVARFEREARALAALNHPNIAQIYGLERLRPSRAEDEDIRGEGSASARAGGGAPAPLEKSGLVALALVMELVEGPTLADRIAQGPLPLDEALPIARQIAEALEVAHEQGIIHRDLKPANVKVRDDGTVKVLDFGLAKLTDPGALTGDPSLSPTFTSLGTMQGTIVGTAAYMSPEQARGRPVDKRTDVWAFGAVLYEMLTGRRAFQGDDATEIIASVVKTTPDWTPLDASAPSAIRGLVRGCLEKDRKARVGDLSVARFLLSSAAPAETPAPAASPQSRFAFLPWAVAAVFLVVAAGVGVVHFGERPVPPRSYRFQLPSPERVQFRLSPDGSRVVYGLGSQPNDRLAVLSLDSAKPVPLAGTEGAQYPFWSPDGREIGFFTRDKLKKIPAAGGLPVTLCDVINGRGGAWNRDGVILFAPDAFGGLYRVSSTSSTPIAVTKVDEKTDGGDRFPEFLPDGDRFLFLRSASKEGGLYTTSLSGGPVTRIIPDISNGIYVPGRSAGGFLLFRRDNTLMALPFDAGSARTTGGVIPIADQVSVAGNIGYSAFSAAQDGTVMFRTGAREGNRQMIWLDRAGKRLGLIGKPDEISVPALSPDGKVVAFTIGNTTAGVADVWLQNLETGGQSRFTLGGGMANGAPLWAPDGSRIVYTSASGNTWRLWQLSAAGAGSPEVILQGPYNSPNATDWSKDGKLIVFHSRTEKTKDDLYLLSTEGDHKAIPFLQTSANEVNAKFSPDGQWLAYSSDESGAPEVFVQHVPANGTKIQISMAGGSFPVWSRDGKELFFRDLTQSMIAVPVKAGATFERGEAHVLFDGTRSKGQFEVSADGQRFLAVTTADGAEQPTFTVITNWQPEQSQK